MKDPDRRLEHLGTCLTSAVGQARSWNELYQPTQVVPRSLGGKGERPSKTNNLSEHVREAGELSGC